MSEELRFEIIVNETLEAVVPGCISFENGATPEEVADGTNVVYEHHGPGFTDTSKGALTCFYEDLIFARPLPLRFATRRINDVDTALAVALFLHRSIAIAPNTTSFVASVDLVHRWGLPAFAHVPEEHGRFIRFMRRHLLVDNASTREHGSRLTDVIGWIRDYLEHDMLPTINEPQTSVRVIDHGTNGFVAATADGDDLTEGWVQLFRQGFLRGVLMGPDREGRRNVVIARKTDAVELDLDAGAMLFDELEVAHGEIPGWSVRENLLVSPERGTIITLSEMIEILVRL